MKTIKQNHSNTTQGDFYGLIWRPFHYRFRIRVNDVIRVDGRLGRVIRVTECAAVIVINQSTREFKTIFDRPVRFQPKPRIVRIASDSTTEILNRKSK